MAFQSNTQPPDLVGLALNLMQMRRDNELAQRKMALEEARLQFDQQQSAIQAQRDAEDWNLTKRERAASLLDQGIATNKELQSQEMNLGDFLSAVNNPLLQPAQRESAGRAFNAGVLQQVDMGRDPSVVGANAGAGAAVFDQQAAREAGIKEADAQRADRYAARADARAESYRIRAEERAAKAKKLEASAEAEAAANGVWSESALDKKRASVEAQLAFVPDIERDLSRLKKLNPKDSTDVLELLQKWQRKVDQGATVREGDIALIRSVNASGADSLFADAKGFFDKNGRFPPGFGDKLKASYMGMLEEEDGKAAAIIDDFDAYAEANGWTPGQKNRAMPAPRSVQKVRERIAARSVASPTTEIGAAGSPSSPADSAPTDAEYEAAENRLRASGRYKRDIPPAVLNAEVQRVRAAGGK